MFVKGYQWDWENFCWRFQAINGSHIVITVPHDVIFPADLYGFFESREDGCFGADRQVWPIVKDIMLQTKVHSVRGFIPRGMIDFNRYITSNEKKIFGCKETQIAFKDNQLRVFYDQYHSSIDRLLESSIEVFGGKRVLLLDFHGFNRQPSYGEYDIILGTLNRKTLYSDVDQLLYDYLMQKGYRVFLPKEESVIHGKVDFMNGQFTVYNYSMKYKVSAIQVEIHSRFRVREGADMGRQLSVDFAEFFAHI